MIQSLKKKNNSLFFIILLLAGFLISCYTVSKEYIVVRVESVHIENLEEEKQLNQENLIGFFTPEKDSVVVYKLNSENLEQIDYKKIFFSTLKKSNTRIFSCSDYSETITVVFKGNNLVKVNNVSFYLNQKYYKHLEKKLLKTGSIIELINLIKVDFMEDRYIYEPLIYYKWNKQTADNSLKIDKILISNNHNENLEIKYLDGEASTDFYSRSFNLSDGVVKIEYLNSKIEIEKRIYTDKKTKLDSVVGHWALYSNNIEHNFIKYQSKLDIKTTSFIPKNSDQLKKLMIFK